MTKSFISFLLFLVLILVIESTYGQVGEKQKYSDCQRISDSLLKNDVYDYIEGYEYGYSIVSKNGRNGVIDKTGELIVDTTYFKLWGYNENLLVAIVYDNNKSLSYGLINTKNDVVLELKFDEIFQFSPWFLLVKQNNKYAIVDSLGNFKTPFNIDGHFSMHMNLYENQYLHRNGKQGVYDYKGNLIVPLTFDTIIENRKYLYCYKTTESFSNEPDTLCSVYSKALNKFITYDKYPQVFEFNGDYAIVSKCNNDDSFLGQKKNASRKYGVIDLSGNEILSIEYDLIEYAYYGKFDFIVQKDSMFGIAGKNGELVIPTSYSSIWPLKDSTMIVTKNGKAGIINPNGEVLIPLLYDNVFRFSHGVRIKNHKKVYLANKDSLYLIFDSVGNVIHKDIYGYLGKKRRISNFIAIKNGKYAILDENFNLKYLPEVDKVLFVFDVPGSVRVKQNGKYGVFNVLKFDYLFEPKYDYIEYLGWEGYRLKINGLSIIADEYGNHIITSDSITKYYMRGPNLFLKQITNAKGNKLYGLTTVGGEIIIPCIYNELRGYYNSNKEKYYVSEILDVNGNMKLGVIKENGKVVFDPVFDKIQSYSGRYPNIKVRVNDKFGVVSTSGDTIVPPIYKSVELVNYTPNCGCKDYKVWLNFEYKEESNNHSTVKMKTKGIVGLYDYQGNMIIKPLYNDFRFIQGDTIFPVRKDSLWGYIDINGIVISEPKFDYVYCFYGKYGIVLNNGKYGIIGTDGKMILQCEYDDLEVYEVNKIMVSKDGKFAVINEKGDLIIPWRKNLNVSELSKLFNNW